MAHSILNLKVQIKEHLEKGGINGRARWPLVLREEILRSFKEEELGIEEFSRRVGMSSGTLRVWLGPKKKRKTTKAVKKAQFKRIPLLEEYSEIELKSHRGYSIIGLKFKEVIHLMREDIF